MFTSFTLIRTSAPAQLSVVVFLLLRVTLKRRECGRCEPCLARCREPPFAGPAIEEPLFCETDHRVRSARPCRGLRARQATATFSGVKANFAEMLEVDDSFEKLDVTNEAKRATIPAHIADETEVQASSATTPGPALHLAWGQSGAGLRRLVERPIRAAALRRPRRERR